MILYLLRYSHFPHHVLFMRKVAIPPSVVKGFTFKRSPSRFVFTCVVCYWSASSLIPALTLVLAVCCVLRIDVECNPVPDPVLAVCRVQLVGVESNPDQKKHRTQTKMAVNNFSICMVNVRS